MKPPAPPRPASACASMTGEIASAGAVPSAGAGKTAGGEWGAPSRSSSAWMRASKSPILCCISSLVACSACSSASAAARSSGAGGAGSCAKAGEAQAAAASSQARRLAQDIGFLPLPHLDAGGVEQALVIAHGDGGLGLGPDGGEDRVPHPEHLDVGGEVRRGDIVGPEQEAGRVTVE